KANVLPEETMMIGNDVDEDILPTKGLGMNVYLVTDCLINKSGADLSDIQHGSFRELLNYARMLPDVKK
ncbi:MAG: HAD family hydrolase, partial [Ruminococcus sp.]